MTKYEVVPATDEHAVALAAVMRKADIDEVWAACRFKPLEALRMSMLVSRDPSTGLADGRPVCMFGVGEFGTIIAPRTQPWLLGAEELPKHARTFLRMNRSYIKRVREQYSVLENYVDARNALAIRWLKWLGFDIKEPVIFGPDGLLFHPFIMVR